MYRSTISRLLIVGLTVALHLGMNTCLAADPPLLVPGNADRGVAKTEQDNTMNVASMMETDLRTMIASNESCELITLGKSTEERSIAGVSCLFSSLTTVNGEDSESLPTVLVVAGGNGNSRLASKCAVRVIDWFAKWQREDEVNATQRPFRVLVIPNWNIDRSARCEHASLVPTTAVDSDSSAKGLQQKIGSLNPLSIDIYSDFIRLDSAESQAMAQAVHSWNVRCVLHLEDAFEDPSSLAPTSIEPTEEQPTAVDPIWKSLRESLSHQLAVRPLLHQHTALETSTGQSKDLSRALTFGEWLVFQNIPYAKLELKAATSSPGSTSIDYANAIGDWLASGFDLSLALKDSSSEPTEAPVALRQDDRELLAAYLIPSDYAWCASRLKKHGLKVKQVVEANMSSGHSGSGSACRWIATELMNNAGEPGIVWSKVAVAIETVADYQYSANDFLVEAKPSQLVLLNALMSPSSPVGMLRMDILGTGLTIGEAVPVIGLRKSPAEDVAKELQTIPATEQLSIEKLFRDGRAISYGGPKLDLPRWLNDPASIEHPEYVIELNDESLGVDAANGRVRRLTLLGEFQKALELLPSIDESEAEKLANLEAFTDDWRFALVTRNGAIVVYDRAQQKASVVIQEQEQESTLPPQKVDFGSIPPLSDEKQHVQLSSDGKRVAWVQRNDLYVATCEDGRVTRLTSDGDEEHLNGTLDWVYQEELYGRGNFKGYWWSPNGRYIAYLSLDQTAVPTYQVSDSTSFAQTLEATRYPKAGQPLPIARLFVTDTQSGTTTPLSLDSFPDDDRLVVRVTWSPSDELWVQAMNRIQNRLQLVRFSPLANQAKVVLEESTKNWIEIRGEPKFTPQGEILWLSDLPDGRTRLYRVDPNDGSRKSISGKNWDISEVHSISGDGKTVFASGNFGGPTEQHLVRIDLENGEEEQMTKEPGTHRVSVDRSGRFYLDHFSCIDTPPTVRCHTVDGGQAHIVSGNFNDRHEYVSLTHPKIFQIPTSAQGSMQAMVMLPKGHLEQGKPTQLPVIVHVYGGPQTPTIRNAWDSRNYWWHQMLTQQGFAVVLCDNRAALGAGISDTWNIAGNMGAYELKDLEATVAWIRAQPWAAPDRIGIWGWSYGGYFTAYSMTHTDLFRCGIAGAPVTDWHNYDAIYTERYMRLPDENADGYKSASVLEAAANLKGQLLIIHGEKDDNVHVSNTLQLVNALQAAGKQFELMIYPKNRHGITEPHQREHLHRLMTDFFRRNL